jgi:TonB family protein
MNDANAFNRIVTAVFGVSAEEAVTLVSFIRSDQRKTKSSSVDIGKMVKGICSKGTFPQSASTQKEAPPPELERKNALLALRFRPQESIRDSIARHLPDLELIYKKQLKLNEMAGGLVWVVFCVDAEGRVLSATVKSSAIANRQFQQLLAEYVRTIHFKAIPKNIGPMVFEFPFEFKSEG